MVNKIAYRIYVYINNTEMTDLILVLNTYKTPGLS